MARVIVIASPARPWCAGRYSFAMLEFAASRTGQHSLYVSKLLIVIRILMATLLMIESPDRSAGFCLNWIEH
jgi:hypothetical protein